MFYNYFDPLNVMFHMLAWILFIWLIIWLVRGARRRHHMWCDGRNCNHPMHSTSALDILKERYVKGEIDTAEFEEKKKNLTQ